MNSDLKNSLIHRLLRYAVAGLRENFQRRGKDGGAHGLRFPAEQKLRGGTANASLAWAHAAAGLEFGGAPGWIRMQARVLDVLATADDCFGRSKGAQFVAKRKGAAESVYETRG